MDGLKWTDSGRDETSRCEKGKQNERTCLEVTCCRWEWERGEKGSRRRCRQYCCAVLCCAVLCYAVCKHTHAMNFGKSLSTLEMLYYLAASQHHYQPPEPKLRLLCTAGPRPSLGNIFTPESHTCWKKNSCFLVFCPFASGINERLSLSSSESESSSPFSLRA